MTKPLILNTVTVAETHCSCSGRKIIDGIPYDCVDPGCIVHGLEAKMKAKAPYYAERNLESEPISMKGRE